MWNKLLLASLVVTSVACSRTGREKEFSNEAPKEFRVRTQDTLVNREAVNRTSAKTLLVKKSGEVYLDRTNQIFELAEIALDLAVREKDAVKRKSLIGLSDKLRSTVYSSPNNTTWFNHESTPYLELALGITYEGPEDLKGNVAKILGVQKNQMSEALKTLTLDLKPQQVFPPDFVATLEEYEVFLRALPDHLRRYGIEEKGVKESEDVLTKDYLPIFEKSKVALSNLSLEKKPEDNLNLIRTELNKYTFFPESILGPVFKDLDETDNLIKKIRSTTDSFEVFDLILMLWTHPKVDREKIRNKSSILYNFLNSLDTPEKLEWVRNYNATERKWQRDKSWWERRKAALNLNWTIAQKIFKEKSSSPAYWVVMLDAAKVYIEVMGVNDVKEDIIKVINEKVLKDFDDGLRLNSGAIVAFMRDEIQKKSDKKFAEIESDLKAFLRKEGVTQLQEKMFKEHSRFRGVEDAYVSLVADSNQGVVGRRMPEPLVGVLSQVSPITNGVVTSAETVGMSLSLQAKRMQLFGKDYPMDPTSLEYYEEVFGPLNKMMAVCGYRYMEQERRFPGMFRMIKGSGGLARDMDIFAYEKELGYFAMPDRVVIDRNFEVNHAATAARGLKNSVAGNAALINGAAHMMNYYKDWNQNEFDIKMGTEQYKGFSIFPKDAFYALSMGVGSVPLRNLLKDGMVGITLSGKEKKGGELYKKPDVNSDECPKPDMTDPALFVGLVDVSPSGTGNIVKTADIARYILAGTTFLSSLEGAENSKAKPIQLVVDGKRPNVQAVVCGRKSLKLLILGLSYFLTSRMQDVDGGFAHAYSLAEKRVVNTPEETVANRYLEDQLLAIRALLASSHLWNSQGFEFMAVDAYHFLNAKMFDEKLGFYKSQLFETTKAKSDQQADKVDARVFAMLIHTLNELTGRVPQEDAAQLEFLRSTWLDRLDQFSQELSL